MIPVSRATNGGLLGPRGPHTETRGAAPVLCSWASGLTTPGLGEERSRSAGGVAALCSIWAQLKVALPESGERPADLCKFVSA